MKISGRKMFVFLLLTTLFSGAIFMYMFFVREMISVSGIIAYFVSMLLIASIVLTLNSIEKIRRMASTLKDLVKKDDQELVVARENIVDVVVEN